MGWLYPLNRAKYLMILGLAVSLIYFSLIPYTIVLIVLISIGLLKGEEFIIPSIIVLSLILVSDIIKDYRSILNVSLISVLILLYIKQKGFSFDDLKTIPGDLKYAVLFIIGVMIVSSIFSEDVIYALITTGRQILFFIVVFILYSFLRTDKALNSYIYALIITGLILGAALFYQALSDGWIVFSMKTRSVNNFSGLYENSNALGLFLTVAVPLALGLFIIRDWKSSKLKYAGTGVFIFLFLVLLLTNSRASVGAVMLSSFYILIRLKPHTIKYVMLGMLGVILIFIVVPTLNDLISIYFRVERIFENTRYYIWEMSYDIIKNNFFLGVGPGLFETKIYTYLPVMMGTFEEYQIWWAKGGTSHNIFLFKFAENGIFGLISIVYLYIVIFKMFIRNEKKFKLFDEEKFKLSVVITSIGLGMFAHTLLETNGVVTNGWITRDLPFWLILLFSIYLAQDKKPAADL